MLHPRKVSFFDKAGRTSKRPASAGRFELQGHLQFLQFLASEAFLEAFACLPAFALELSLAAEACLPFALDPVFSMFTPLGDRPVFRLLPVEGSMPLRSWFYTFLVGELFPRAIFRRQAFISARACDEAATTFLVLRMPACSPHFVIEVALSPYTPLKARE